MKIADVQSSHFRVLIVDDNAAIHEDLRKVLGDGGGADQELAEDEAILFGEKRLNKAVFELESAFQGQEALGRLQQALAEGRPFALAFIDIRMPPGWDGVETITHLWAADPDLQVVICTAYSDYSWNKMVRRLQATDNLIILKKPFDNIEVVQLAYALTRKWQVTRQARLRMEDLDRLVEQRTAELLTTNEQLRSSEERFAKAFTSSPMSLAILERAGDRFVDVNPRFLEVTGYSRQDVIGRTPADLQLWPEDKAGGWVTQWDSSEPVRETACAFRLRGGETREGLVSTENFQLGGTPHRLLILQDISERLRMERQLRRAQKAEAVGQLVAGIAHHFNSLHAIIQGNLCLSEGCTRDPQLLEYLAEVSAASRRAAGLTQELLAFNRQQSIRLQAVNLKQLLLNLRAQLAETLGPAVEMTLQFASEVPPLMADADCLEWTLKQLCANARDAMPTGGRWTLATEVISAKAVKPPPDLPLEPGPFICLSATDIGVGMEPAVLDRLFEPFFSTKEAGKGSGLALASIYGMIRQHHGWIEVASEPGKGSTFRIFLPAGGPTASAESASEG